MKTALPAIHITKTTRYVLEADFQLASDIDAFAEFYQRVHNAKVEQSHLVKEIVRSFLANDTDFQAFRSKPRRKRKATAQDVQEVQV